MDKSTTTRLWLGAALAVVCLAYANHFGNSFHFDDNHTIVANPFIRDLSNIPKFFTDTATFSKLPANQTWRPLVSTSLAVDYWLAGGLEDTTWFHVSTFCWFLVQLCLMYALFDTIVGLAAPDPFARYVALFATALYGLHPAIAETVNYVIQRGDVYSTLGVVAALAMYARFPGRRAQGWYLIPLALGLLSKPPALVFPAILVAYLTLLERQRILGAAAAALPSLGLVVAYGLLARAMTPVSYTPTAGSAHDYWMTQPLVAFHYFRSFFLPIDLSADTDMRPVSSLLQDGAWAGVLFVVAIVVVAVWCGRRRDLRPVAFGLCWYLLALLPTALFPLEEVKNDHRMFFPFVGLALAVSHGAALLLGRLRLSRVAVAALCVLVLATAATGTYRRNQVWRSEESLWYDVTLKSPRNGRGLVNYALTQIKGGHYEAALDCFTRAQEFYSDWFLIETNLGIAHGALGHDVDAERHFRSGVELEPDQYWTRYQYAKWLHDKGRFKEALENLQVAIDAGPAYRDAQHLLIATLEGLHDNAGAERAARAVLARFPGDAVAQAWLDRHSPGAGTAAESP